MCAVLCKFGTMVTTFQEDYFKGNTKSKIIMADPAHGPLKFELFSPILNYLSMTSLIHSIICCAAFETINIINQRPEFVSVYKNVHAHFLFGVFLYG